jgi:hypothetical protein
MLLQQQLVQWDAVHPAAVAFDPLSVLLLLLPAAHLPTSCMK